LGVSVPIINCVGESSSFQFEAQKSILITLNYYYQQIQGIDPSLPASQCKMAEKIKNNKKKTSNVSSKTRYSYIMPLFWHKQHSVVKTIFTTLRLEIG